MNVSNENPPGRVRRSYEIVARTTLEWYVFKGRGLGKVTMN